jgi:endonuclease/exonuclease/phosphatase family metal-dependent hydrolase
VLVRLAGEFAAGAAQAVVAGPDTIVNIHGIWQGSMKGDTEAKIAQSKKILQLAELAQDTVLICGDFNLLPHTRSIQMIGDRYTNLIDTYKITRTRSSLYTKSLPYSDYAFTDATVRSFSVPEIVVSDHLPLVIEIE